MLRKNLTLPKQNYTNSVYTNILVQEDRQQGFCTFLACVYISAEEDKKLKKKNFNDTNQHLCVQ
jgi:hypothetical protein